MLDGIHLFKYKTRLIVVVSIALNLLIHVNAKFILKVISANNVKLTCLRTEIDHLIF